MEIEQQYGQEAASNLRQQDLQQQEIQQKDLQQQNLQQQNLQQQNLEPLPTSTGSRHVVYVGKSCTDVQIDLPDVDI